LPAIIRVFTIVACSPQQQPRPERRRTLRVAQHLVQPLTRFVFCNDTDQLRLHPHRREVHGDVGGAAGKLHDLVGTHDRRTGFSSNLRSGPADVPI
jgi:hypothetical protein